MTVLLRGDLDHGYLLIHQAVLEDIETSGQPRPNTPGYALVSLDYNRVEQAFRQWVMAQAEFLAARQLQRDIPEPFCSTTSNAGSWIRRRASIRFSSSRTPSRA
jgi:hypothetical protein